MGFGGVSIHPFAAGALSAQEEPRRVLHDFFAERILNCIAKALSGGHVIRNLPRTVARKRKLDR